MTLTHKKKGKRSEAERKRSEAKRALKEREEEHWSKPEAVAEAIAKCETLVGRENMYYFKSVNRYYYRIRRRIVSNFPGFYP